MLKDSHHRNTEMRGAIIIEGHIQGLSNVRSLGRSGIPVVVVHDGKGCIARYSKFCNQFFKSPPYDSPDLAYFLKDLAESEHLKGWMLFPSNDHAVMTISRHREMLERYYVMLVPQKPVLEKIYDKVSLLNLAAECGVPAPYTVLPEEHPADWPGFPCLVKGRYGLSFYKKTGKKAFICDDEASLHEVLSMPVFHAYPDLAMVQEVIPSDPHHHTISVASFCVDGAIKCVWMGEKLREHPARFGTATFTNSVYVGELMKHTASLMTTLDFTGICETEFLFDPRDRRYKLIEINPRTWLWVGHAVACGVDFASIAWQFAMGLPVVYPHRYKTGILWRNFYTDFYYSFKSLWRGRLTLKGWFRYFFSGKVPAVWDISDPRPFFMLSGMLPSLARNRSYQLEKPPYL